MPSVSAKEAQLIFHYNMQKRVRLFTSVVSVHFEKAAGILLSYHNATNEHRYSATFATYVEWSLICLHYVIKNEQKKSTRI